MRNGRARGDPAFVEESGEGVYHRCLERLLRLERGEDTGQTRGEHRLSGAGRADHEDVVPPGGSDLQRALGLFLALHLGEILGRDGVGCKSWLRRREDRAAGEVIDEGEEGFRCDHLDSADPGGLRTAGRGADQSAVGLGCGESSGQRADDRDQRTVERELPQRDVCGDLFARQDFHRGQHRQRDW